MRTYLATFCVLAVFAAAVFVYVESRRGVPGFSEEFVTIPIASSQSKLYFKRWRCSYSSAEYEREIVLVNENGATDSFVMQIDGGSNHELIVAQNRTNPKCIILVDDLQGYMVDISCCKAYAVMRSETPKLLPQYCDYNPGFKCRIEPIRDSNELRKVSHLGIFTNGILQDYCEDEWVFIGLIHGKTGELRMDASMSHELPEYIEYSSG